MKTKQPGRIMKRHKIQKEKVNREDYTRIKQQLDEKTKSYKNLKSRIFKFQHEKANMPKISNLSLGTNIIDDSQINSSATNDTDEKQ